MSKLKLAHDTLLLARDALQKVMDNQIYQRQSGAPYFTSAPTELEWKHDKQKETDKAVSDAIEKINAILFDRS